MLRRHAKAPSAGSTAATSRKARGLFGTVCLCVLGLAALFGSGAPSAGAVEACSNEAFRTGASANLPDCRAYEMVSPVEKSGGNVIARTARTRAAVDGSALQFASHTAFGDAQGTGVAVEYVARRTGAADTQGWGTHAITPRQEPLSLVDLILGQLDPRYLELSPDLSKGVFLAGSPIGADPSTGKNVALYRRTDVLDPGAGSYQLVSDCQACTSPLPPFGIRQPGLAGASADFNHVLFESSWNLTQDTIDAGLDENLPKLYEWDHGTVRLAGVLPDGTPAPSSAAGQGAGAGVLPKNYTPNTISSNGTRIVFTSPVNESSGDSAGVADLYLRENHATTIRLNASERTIAPDPNGPQPAKFQAASADLSRIFFTSDEQLTDDDANPNSRDLYMYDASLPDSDPHNLTRLVQDTEPDDGVNSEVSGVAGASRNGDYVYFYSSNQLVDDGVAGSTVTRCDTYKCLFVWHNGDIRLVARTPNGEFPLVIRSDWITTPKGSRMTPDGTRLLFLSDGVVGESYDHGTSCSGDFDGDQGYFNTDGPGCAELYLYDATANGGDGQLTCVSCNPGGTHLTSTEARMDVKTATIVQPTSYLNRAVSDDGRYVFFSTGERLVPEDTNGSVYDTYQYDTTTHQVSLISTGKSPSGSFFLDASADGHDVFFLTRDHLSGWDTDQLNDVYDARIGGGFPDPVTPLQCSGDACHGSQGGNVSLAEPGTATFEGGGNLRDRKASKPKRCPKGKRKVRRDGKVRCVKKKGAGNHQGKSRTNTNRGAGR